MLFSPQGLRFFPLCMVLYFLSLAVPASAAIPRILLVGDSWPWFMLLNQSFTTALEEEGLSQYEVRGLYTTAPGSTARQWVRPEWLEVLREELERFPTIDIVHLSLGGNDYLRRWRPDMAIVKRDAMFNEVAEDIETVVRFLLDVRPDVRVAICEYDYVNAQRGGTGVAPLNQAGQILARMKLEMTKKYPRAGYIQTYGLMQHHFGVGEELAPGVAPLPGQAPDFDPFPGGNKELGNDRAAMMDAIHLSPKGYHVLARHCIRTLYREWLGKPWQAGTEVAPVAAASAVSAR